MCPGSCSLKLCYRRPRLETVQPPALIATVRPQLSGPTNGGRSTQEGVVEQGEAADSVAVMKLQERLPSQRPQGAVSQAVHASVG